MSRDKIEAATWVEHLPPTAAQTRSAVAVAAIALAAFALITPFASMPLGAFNILFPLLDAIVVVTDLITAVLLFAQFSVSRSRSLLVLAVGYLFTAVIVVPHALTFSGAFSPTGLLGAGIQTGSWLFIFWHLGFAAALLGYAALKEEKPAKPDIRASVRYVIGWSVAGVIGLVCGLTWLSTAGVGLLPPIVLDNMRLSPFVVYPIWCAILVSAAAIGLLSMRRRSVLDQWLIVVALVYIGELAFSGLFASIRFSAGFYAGRAFSLITAAIVLIVLLAETTRLHALLARSNAILEREQNNKLLNFEAIVAAIVHEVSQPLAAIELNGSSAHLLLKQTPPDVKELSTISDETTDSGRRISATLDGFRSLFGNIDHERQPVNLNEVILEALQSSRLELRDHGVAVTTELTAELPVFYGDRNQLHQVIFNLVHNAIEAMRSTTDRKRVLEVRTNRQDYATIVVEVVDSGPGIDPEKMTDIFDAFVTTKSHGMGLGLAICRRIIERHNGELSASPPSPRGATFRIVLPESVP